MKVIVDRQKCTVCGVCVDACPFGALSLHETLLEVSDECTLCGMCVDACEFRALSLPEVGSGVSADLPSYKGIWVFAEWREGTVHKVSHELLSVGRALADKKGIDLAAVLLGHNLDTSVYQELIAHGADVVYVVDHPELARFRDETYSQVIVELVRENKPEIILAGATSMGRSFIPRVAALLETGLTADCTDLDMSEDGLLLQTRPAFGGNIMATIICPHRRPQMATVRPKVMKMVKNEGRRGKVETVSLPEACFRSRIEVLEVITETDQTAKLTEADVIVSGGRGLRKGENFALVEELAGLFNGAVGASRGAVEEGWMPSSHQVGQTGRTVAPTLYMAVGIAGAIQHVVGMQGSRFIVAVNKDPEAPIFDIATYGVVADLFEFVPAFVKKIRQEHGLA